MVYLSSGYFRRPLISPDPSFLPPKKGDGPRCTNDRGKCKARQFPPHSWPGKCTAPAAHTAPYLPDQEACKHQGNPGPPPQPGVLRFPRTPSRPPPARGRAARATHDSRTAPTPAATETSDRAAGTPAPRRPGLRGNSPDTAASRPISPARPAARPAGAPPGHNSLTPAWTCPDVPPAVPPGTA